MLHTTQAEITSDFKADPAVDHTLAFKSRLGAPWPATLRACLARAAALEWRRNWPACVVRWLINLFIALAAGSIFWRVPATFAGGASALGMLFWVLCFVLVITVPTVQLTFYRRPVMLRQRRSHMYAGWMDAVPQVCSVTHAAV